MKYLIGENPTKLNLVLLLLSSLAGVVFTLFFLEGSLLIKILSSIIVADIFGGAYSNITRSTNEFYFKKYSNNKLFAPVFFTLLHAIHLMLLLLLSNYFSLIIIFDYLLLIVLSFLKIDYKYHILIILLSLLPGLIGFNDYGIFWSVVMVMLAVKSIVGYKLGLNRVALRKEKNLI
jgi:hypothetical protein